MNPKADAEPQVVVVAGDATIDWNLGRIPFPPDPNVPGKRGTTATSFEPGGAALLGRLITEIAKDIEKPGGRPIEVRTVAEPERVRPGDGAMTHSYAVWSLHDRVEGSSGPRAWRISRPLGIEDIAPESVSPWHRVSDDPTTADLVVLDAGLGSDPPETDWPRAITAPNATPYVILKMARAVGEAALWDHLVSHHAQRLIAVVRANDLRVAEAQISRELSWERSAQDLLWELIHNPEVKQLSRCAHLIVSFGTSGAMLLSHQESAATLFFDPLVMEEEWTERHPGGMVGYTVCLTAAIAREIMRAGDAASIDRGVERGLGAMRNLHLNGADVDDDALPRARFPAERIARSMSEEEEDQSAVFATAPVPEPAMSSAVEERAWTILEAVFTDGLEQVARRIVLEGPDRVVARVPVAKFGKLLTIDRNEIEGYRSVRSLISQYAQQFLQDRPLSIAVFGRPGSGKSFGIKQIALSLLPGRIESLTFNLSQFGDPGQLLDAFHQVRDVSLKGKLPLVFWDEFDAAREADELGWLKHFLAPMQDGEFQHDQITHHIGRAVFVFAGGTKETMLEFSAQFEGPNSERLAKTKGRDFVSRLKGYVDVAGPNPIGDSVKDPHYVIRRAILLRSMLESKTELFIPLRGTKELQIDGGLLRAFLRAEKYLHGARSMESVIAMSLLKGRSRFERSCLPSQDQLSIHVTPDFLDIVRGLVIEGRMLKELAEAIHVAFCAAMLADGSTWMESDDGYLEEHELLRPFAGHVRDPEKAAPSLVPYDKLGKDVTEQNEDFARDIPNKVESIGFRIVLGREGDGDAFGDDVIDLLAEQEHDRWMRLKLGQGWSWGEVRDNERLIHPDLLPWRKSTAEQLAERYGKGEAPRIGTGVLPVMEKDKDRALIKAVSRILAENGYRVIPNRSI